MFLLLSFIPLILVFLQGCFVLDWIFGINLKAEIPVDDDCCDKSSTRKTYPCELCGLEFPGFEELFSHVKSAHPNP